ncbi:MAG: hypothetical protein AAFQ87_21525, partial [Bacteroidota bacterium]
MTIKKEDLAPLESDVVFFELRCIEKAGFSKENIDARIGSVKYSCFSRDGFTDPVSVKKYFDGQSRSPEKGEFGAIVRRALVSDPFVQSLKRDYLIGQKMRAKGKAAQIINGYKETTLSLSDVVNLLRDKDVSVDMLDSLSLDVKNILNNFELGELTLADLDENFLSLSDIHSRRWSFFKGVVSNKLGSHLDSRIGRLSLNDLRIALIYSGAGGADTRAAKTKLGGASLLAALCYFFAATLAL